MKIHLEKTQLIEAIQDWMDAKLFNPGKAQEIVSVDITTGYTEKIEIETADRVEPQ